MKKLVTIAVVFALVFTLAVPTFGVSTTPIYNDSIDPDPGCTLWASMKYLSDDLGQRVRRTPNEAKAAEFVFNKFKEIGCEDVVWHDNITRNSTAYTVGRLVFEGRGDIYGNPSPNTAAFTGFEGEIVDLGGHLVYAVPPGTEGDIVGVVRFTVAPTAALINGIVANIEANYPDVNLTGLIYSRSPVGDVLATSGTNPANGVPAALTGTDVPCMSLTLYHLERVIKFADKFDRAERYTGANTHLVTATKYATIDPDNPEMIIVISAHIDSVINTDGSEDDATGVASIIELARRFKNEDTGGIEIRYAAVGAEETAGFFNNGQAGSAVHADMLHTEGVSPITINLNMDMVAPKIRTNDGYFSGRRNDGRGNLDSISMDVSQQPLGTMSYGNASNANPIFNLPAYLVTDSAKGVVNFDFAPAGVENVRIFNSPYGDHAAYHARGMDASMMIFVRDFDNDASGAYHLPLDNFEDNYCYDSHNITTKLIEMGVRRAINDSVTKRAKFEIKTFSDKVEATLLNADQIFITFDSLTAAINGVSYEFVKGGDSTVVIPAADDYVIGNSLRYNTAHAVIGPAHFVVPARGTGVADNKNTARNERLKNFTTNLNVETTFVDVTPTVKAHIFAAEKSHFKNAIEFKLAISEAINVLAVDFEFVVDGAMLSGSSFEAVNGFTAVTDLKWTDNGDGTWTGAVTLGRPSGDSQGFTSVDPTDIAKFVFDTKGVLGEAALDVVNIKVTGYDPLAENDLGAVVFFNVILVDEETTILYNAYDLNKDGAVDLIDLGIMLMYVGYNEDDPEWDTLVRAVDRNGNGILPRDCDVNGDGEVDMADIVQLLANFD